jgi:hypothetical protein
MFRRIITFKYSPNQIKDDGMGGVSSVYWRIEESIIDE